MSTKTKQSRGRRATPRGKSERDARQDTRKRIRRIVERQRETLDYLAVAS